MNKGFLLLFTFSIATGAVTAQSQFVVLKREKELLRLQPGDIIIYKLKGAKQRRRSYINELYDTAFSIHDDTIPFRKVERLYFRQDKYINVIGGVLMAAGSGYFLVDQINEVIVHGNKPRLDEAVTRSAIKLTLIGAPLFLIRKKSQRIRYPVKILTARPGSPFYKSN